VKLSVKWLPTWVREAIYGLVAAEILKIDVETVERCKLQALRAVERALAL